MYRDEKDLSLPRMILFAETFTRFDEGLKFETF